MPICGHWHWLASQTSEYNELLTDGQNRRSLQAVRPTSSVLIISSTWRHSSYNDIHSVRVKFLDL